MLDIQYHFMAYLSFLCLKTHFLQGWRHRRGGGRGAIPLTNFLGSKKKRGKQRKKRKFFKAETIKGCHQGQNVTVLPF